MRANSWIVGRAFVRTVEAMLDGLIWFIWFVWLIWLIWSVQLVLFNQTNETNQINQITVFLRWPTVSASC